MQTKEQVKPHNKQHKTLPLIIIVFTVLSVQCTQCIQCTECIPHPAELFASGIILITTSPLSLYMQEFHTATTAININYKNFGDTYYNLLKKTVFKSA